MGLSFHQRLGFGTNASLRWNPLLMKRFFFSLHGPLEIRAVAFKDEVLSTGTCP